ncbi:MAG: hypothetical protein E6G57_11355 [Actinobacteria bacterium]|nr:MAG: hypothetical protein E6G57_11355 [Actinomycetota bacterium]
MRTRIVSVAPLLALLIAACGGGGGKSSSTTSAPSTTAASASSATTLGTDEAAIAQGKKLVFVQSDFPAGWTATASGNSPEDKATNKQLDACIGTSGDEAKSADVKGDDFNMGQGTQVSSEAQIVKSEATYHADVAAVKGPKLQSCLQDFVTKGLTKAVGSAPASVQLTDFSVPSYGDVTIGKRMTAALTAQGQTINVVVDFVLMAKSKAEVTASFTNLGQPFDPALETSLINKLGTRVKES